jgi:hypothetical protein
MTYAQFLILLNVHPSIQPSIKIENGEIITLNEWKDLLIESGINIETTEMCGQEIRLEF